MNRAIAAVYAISIGCECKPDGSYTDAVKDRLIEKIPDLTAEIMVLESKLRDPFIQGYLEAKRTGCFSPSSSEVQS